MLSASKGVDENRLVITHSAANDNMRGRFSIDLPGHARDVSHELFRIGLLIGIYFP
jgi:hypothetical protein